MVWILADSAMSEAWDDFKLRAAGYPRLRKYAIRAGFGAFGAMMDGERAVDVIQPGFNGRVKIAEMFEKENRANAEFIKNLKVQVSQKLVDRVRSGPSNWTLDDVFLWPATGAISVFEMWYKTITGVSEAYVDVLKLGQGVLVEKSAGGWFRDGLRLLQILPGEAAAQGMKTHLQSRGAKLAQQIPKQPGTWWSMECVTNSAARAMALTRRRLFTPIIELWTKSKVPVPPGRNIYTDGVHIREVAKALEGLGVRTALVKQPTYQQIIQAAESNPNGAVIFAVEMIDPATKKRCAHAMVASTIEGRVAVYDTAGQIYKSWADVMKRYPTIAGPWYEMLIVRGATLMHGLDIAIKHGDLWSVLVVQLRYVSLATPIIIETAHEYVEKVALRAGKKPDSDKTKEQQHQSDKTKPYSEQQGGEVFWREDR